MMADKYIEISKDNGNMKIVTMSFPYRKKIGLGIYDRHTNTITKVATFNSEDSADMFMEYLSEFVGARNNYNG